ncbi:MAG: FAD-dependent oxidoreductase, partial [Acidimicrobiales bacterium]
MTDGPDGRRALLTGWGRTAPTSADVVHAVHPDIVDRAMASTVAGAGTDRGLIARGLGRSYGDAAQNAGGLVVDATWLDAVHGVDLEHGLITVGAGISLETLMQRFVPLGWFVPVTPGTRLVTVGGAIAADIHGKNHHIDGAFCSHVLEMTLVTPTGKVTLSPASDPDLF